MRLLKFFKAYFLGSFEANNFAFVLYPVARIFKLLGFAPVKLKNGEIFRENSKSLQWDLVAFVRALVGVTLQIIGFFLGVHQLKRSKLWESLHDSTIITYISTWAQILTLFVVGVLAIVTSWTSMPDMQQLCVMIFRIDYQLQQITQTKIDYNQLRKQLFMQLIFASFIPLALSMVNCMVLPSKFSPTSTCYWFICFVPIMLITLKEFQFYNLMFLLKSKFDLLNACLRRYGRVVCRNQVIFVWKVRSVSEVPLAPISSAKPMLENEDYASAEKLQALLELYALIADCVDLTIRLFAWHLLVMTTVSFGVITIQSYNVFAMCVRSLELKGLHIFYVVAWIMMQMLVIGINVRACSQTSKAMSLTGPLLHKIKLHGKYEQNCQSYQILQVFSLEVLQRKCHFTAAGFFDMDYKLITSIIGAVTCYLVIIIQFHLANLPNEFTTVANTTTA